MNFGKGPNGTGGEQQGQSVLDICGGFICPLCASWGTLTVLLWMTVIHTAGAGVKVLQLKDLALIKAEWNESV